MFSYHLDEYHIFIMIARIPFMARCTRCNCLW